MARKFFVVANPASGRQKIHKMIRHLKDFFESQNCQFELFETSFEKRGHHTVEQNLNDSFTDLVVVGGDGSIYEAVNGLQKDIPVSFLPAGTGDDFIKNFKIGKDIREQLETIISGTVKVIDLGLCNDKKFVNGVGIGFDGQIVADMAKKEVRFLSGHAKYYYHVLQILSSYKEREFHYRIEGEELIRKNIAMTIANGTTFGGGFKLTPNAKLDDGFLDVCEIGKISAFKRYRNIYRLQSGTHGALKEINFYSVKEIYIDENPLLEAHIDGELLGNPPFLIKVLPQALKIRVKQF